MTTEVHTLSDTRTPIDHISDRRSMADTPLQKFFEAAVCYESSDLLLRGGQAPKLRLKG